MPSSGSVSQTRVAAAGILSILCRSLVLLNPEGDGTTVLQIVANYSHSNALHPRRIYHQKNHCGNLDVTCFYGCAVLLA